jgi:glycerol-3-phosphate acyltransferase PlsX
VCIAPLLKQFCADINPSRYNGASFLGFTSTLVKSHGGADADAFFNAITVAKKEAIENIPQKIHQSLQQLFAK